MPFKIGCHLSSAGGYLAMGQTAASIGANVFQFFTRNPRGGAAKPIDKQDVKAFLAYAAENGIGNNFSCGGSPVRSVGDAVVLVESDGPGGGIGVCVAGSSCTVLIETALIVDIQDFDLSHCKLVLCCCGSIILVRNDTELDGGKGVTEGQVDAAVSPRGIVVSGLVIIQGTVLGIIHTALLICLSVGIEHIDLLVHIGACDKTGDGNTACPGIGNSAGARSQR